MDMSWQTTFTLVCAAVLAAVVPGTLGYATARLETADQQRLELIRLRAEVQAARKTVRRVSTQCEAEGGGTGSGTSSSGSSGSSGDRSVPASPDMMVRPLPPQAGSEPSEIGGTLPEQEPALEIPPAEE
ncbi:hypothetical protein [Sphaerisporangium perillae]|uniref:hypothetical protein n=1 Tax=Sphaerisporangium perillae TaxID=2935860 RepID=UPI00200CBFF4|nr:hypothetical protein [Sphaerisporangium perillae]